MSVITSLRHSQNRKLFVFHLLDGLKQSDGGYKICILKRGSPVGMEKENELYPKLRCFGARFIIILYPVVMICDFFHLLA